MKDFRQLQIWQRSHKLALEMYRVTGAFPKHELYGLVSQMRRSASSVPTNIAEGSGRDTDLEYQLILAHDLQYLDDDDFHRISTELVEIKRMLNAFIQKLRANHKSLTTNRSLP